jgi:hypothetical protein
MLMMTFTETVQRRRGAFVRTPRNHNILAGATGEWKFAQPHQQVLELLSAKFPTSRAYRAKGKPRLNRNGKKGRHKGGQNSFISGDAASHSDGPCLFPNHSDGPDRLGAL